MTIGENAVKTRKSGGTLRKNFDKYYTINYINASLYFYRIIIDVK